MRPNKAPQQRRRDIVYFGLDTSGPARLRFVRSASFSALRQPKAHILVVVAQAPRVRVHAYHHQKVKVKMNMKTPLFGKPQG